MDKKGNNGTRNAHSKRLSHEAVLSSTALFVLYCEWKYAFELVRNAFLRQAFRLLFFLFRVSDGNNKLPRTVRFRKC